MPNYQFVPINDLRPGDEIASNNGAEVMRVIEVTPGGEYCTVRGCLYHKGQFDEESVVEYRRVDGEPFLLLHRPSEASRPKATTKPITHVCRDCGVKEGALHQLGCFREQCPFCGGQLVSCGCCYRHFYKGYDPRINRKTFEPLVKNNGLPYTVFEKGLRKGQLDKWGRVLEEKGRVPYIVFPVLCARCGTLWPEFFKVPDDEWIKYIPPRERDMVICRPCYDWIKKVIDEARQG